MGCVKYDLTGGCDALRHNTASQGLKLSFHEWFHPINTTCPLYQSCYIFEAALSDRKHLIQNVLTCLFSSLGYPDIDSPAFANERPTLCEVRIVLQ
jgi:hypothetical protein